ncbi:hypothetical protein ACZ76_10850 [Yersinia aleksiciae]|uniref:Uncharacterized protein n=1 Tax=Yersinia aleksiciae TaxID=263819 RepID=A0ABN4H771_YERAE|nr:hypothetical protein ACZ76_10850 [Yersinia aleksiciae]
MLAALIKEIWVACIIPLVIDATAALAAMILGNVYALFCQYQFSCFGLAQLVAFALMDDKGDTVLPQQLLAGDGQGLTCRWMFNSSFIIQYGCFIQLFVHIINMVMIIYINMIIIINHYSVLHQDIFIVN